MGGALDGYDFDWITLAQLLALLGGLWVLAQVLGPKKEHSSAGNRWRKIVLIVAAVVMTVVAISLACGGITLIVVE